jgi:hypothetical protein
LLRNDYSWGLLSDAEKKSILAVNEAHDTERESLVLEQLLLPWLGE